MVQNAYIKLDLSWTSKRFHKKISSINKRSNNISYRIRHNHKMYYNNLILDDFPINEIYKERKDNDGWLYLTIRYDLK